MNVEKLHDTMDSLSELLGYTTPSRGEVQSLIDDDLKAKILKCWQEKDFHYVSVDELYAEFNEMFGKEAIKNFTDEECLLKLFGKKDDKSLGYFLEHVKKFKYFGKVGGPRTVYTLYEQNEVWKYCPTPFKRVKDITLEEAKKIAREYRDDFVALFDAIDNLLHTGALLTEEGFAQFQNELKNKLGVLYNHNWVWKYLHMIYPNLFITVYSSIWVNKIFRVAKLIPESSYVRQCRQFSRLSEALGLKNVYLYHILCHLDDAEEIQEGEAGDEETDDEEAVESDELPVRAPRTQKRHSLNTILYGAPGTGKTYSTAEYALAIIENREVDPRVNWATIKEKYQEYVKNGQIVFTTFHQSYCYEDFIQGLSPVNVDGVMEFKPVDGIFKAVADRAMRDTENNYVIIIDEINRANISKVLGELITLLEEDKRWGEEHELSVVLPAKSVVADPTKSVFAVPNNLYIVGTMNTADKSISLIDTALRRRFTFIEITPNAALVQDAALRAVLERLNQALVKEFESTDLLIGHAYFMGKSKDDLCDIMNQSIIPLLYEYYYDNRKKVEKQVKEAIGDLPFEIDNVSVGRLKLVKKDR